MRGRVWIFAVYIPPAGTLQVSARLCRELIQRFQNFWAM